MANVYRDQYVDKVLQDVSNDVYVDPDRLQTAIKYVKEAEATLERTVQRLINKEKKSLEKAHKELDVQLSDVEE